MTKRRLTTLGLALSAFMALSTPAWAASDEGAWVWPLQPTPPIVAGFAPPDEVWQAGHRGVDLLGSGGQSVLAIGTGRVTFAGPLAGRGVVVVDHGELRSTYEPVLAQVAVGEVVPAGQPVGLLQSVRSHCAPRTCLHLGLKRGETYLDPLDRLPDRAVRLKPLDGDVSSGLAGSSAAGADARDSPVAPAGMATESRLGVRSVLGGAAAVTAAVLAVGRTRRPQARG